MKTNEGKTLVMSPLADPVFSAIYANAEVAGLAMESFIRAVLEADNETLAGKVTSLTPQRVHASTDRRGCRVDIESDTDENEHIVTEVQLNPDASIMVRNLFTASHIFRETSVKGDTSSQMSKRMPRIVHINLLAYIVRESGDRLLEPFKIMYTNEPEEVAISNFSGYNIQLPNIDKTEPDFDSPLYCWCFALYEAHTERKTLKEVVGMSKALQDYAMQDPGFKQFCDRYEFVSSDPRSQKEYVAWVNDVWREAGMKEAAWLSGEKKGMQQGLQQGLQQGVEIGRKEGIEAVAVAMLKRNQSITDVSDLTSLPIKEVEALKCNL